jgi:hypothetical protein
VTDLIEFLNARLDEDWRAADGLASACRLPDKVPDFFACGGPAAEAYWGRFTAHRVLREVEAKRAILAMWEDQRSYNFDEGIRNALRLVVRQLAAVYSDLPDYREEWKQ